MSYTSKRIPDLTTARQEAKAMTEYQRLEVHVKNLNRVGEYTGTSVYGSDKLDTVDAESFSHAVLVTGPYPMNLRDEELVAWLAQNGIADDFTYRLKVGVRAGERAGYASEVTPHGTYEAVRYEPEGVADGRYPYGSKRTVITDPPRHRAGAFPQKRG